MKDKIHRVNDSIFEEVGLSHPKRVQARAQVMFRITEIIKELGLTQKDAAKVLGLPQSKVSCLMNGKLSMFSLDHLFEMLNALDSDVEIIIHPKNKKNKKAETNVLVTSTSHLRDEM